MSKRLQVLLDDKEFRSLKAQAKRDEMTVAEWVRRALRAAKDHSPGRAAAEKRRALDEAMRIHAPTGDIEDMLREIEAGAMGDIH